MTQAKTILLSAGGTGGHVTPAVALAHELTAKGHKVEIATDPRAMKYAPMFNGLPVHEIPSSTLGAGIKGKIKGVIGLTSGILKAFALVKRTQPDIVIGFGGYPSVPAVLAAQALRIPTALHEQNAVLGKANALLAKNARHIALSLPLKQPAKVEATLTGNPVRADIEALRDQPYPAPKNKDTIRIVIMGGSLGATILSETVPEALKLLSPDHKARISIIQQCREADLKDTQKRYEGSGIDVQLETFIHDVPDQLQKAHLFIGRSGASTVVEMAIAGRPAIYIPYAKHKDQQQKHNALTVANKGGAWVMEEPNFTPEALKEQIETFLNAPETLTKAAQAARNCAAPNAAQKLADLTIKLASGNS